VRFTIRRMMVAVAVISLVIGVTVSTIRWNDPTARYRRNHDDESLRAILSSRVENGDRVEKLRELLGPLKRYENPKFYRRMATYMNEPGFTGRDGFREGDEFFEFDSGPGSKTLLQVRDGHLVNFIPREYLGSDTTEAKAM
jgi:hypothetical protein